MSPGLTASASRCESPRVGKVGCEAKGLLDGAEGLGRFLVGLEGQCQVVVDVGSVGKPFGGGGEIVDRLSEMTQREMGTAAKVAGLAILGCELDHLVESRQRLIRLAPRELDGRDREADFGVIRFELRRAEVLRQRLVGFSLGFQQLTQARVSPRPMRVDLDGRFKCLRADASSPR